MLRTALMTAVVMVMQPAFAQRGGGDRGQGQGERGQSLMPAGTELPIVKAFDEQGLEFSTESLKGSYTVLVFGCLT